MAQIFIPGKELLQPQKSDYSETLRYLGYHKVDVPEQSVQELLDAAVPELYECIKPQGVFETFPVQVEYDEAAGKGIVQFAQETIQSADLARNLRQCSQVTIFAATIGPMVDSLIRRTQIKDPAKAAVLQSAGAMFAEKFVDLLNEKIEDEIKAQGLSCRPRFSPGYGDLALETQKIFFRLLPCSRIGLSLMDTLIMSPEKSVTAFAGSGR